jgi:hypothetical protein
MKAENRPINVPRRFDIWSRITGTQRAGLLGLRFARIWPACEHREVDIRITRRCGLELGFEGLVCGMTADSNTGKLFGLMVRENQFTRMLAPREIPLDRILGLRDPVFGRLMTGSHRAIDDSIIRSLGRSALSHSEQGRIACLCALGRFSERRQLSLNSIKRVLEEMDALALVNDPLFNSRVTAA